MADIFDVLGKLSEYSQRHNITIVETDKAIKITIRVFDSMVNKPGHELADASLDIE